jgi:CheY-like chemotaxis protein
LNKPPVVLLVDDDNDDVLLFQQAIEVLPIHVEVKVAYNGKEAIDMLNSDFVPNKIFLDINMPVMDGIECLTHIRHMLHCKSIPVVMLTTSNWQKDKQICNQLGAEFLIKPNTFKELVNCLSIHLDDIATDAINAG